VTIFFALRFLVFNYTKNYIGDYVQLLIRLGLFVVQPYIATN